MAATRLDVRVERLPHMWVASVVGVGESPEAQAWQRLRKWATRKGYWNDWDRHPVFGFNNPAPSPGRHGYGYELWMRIDGPDAVDDESVQLKEFPGGLFAVTACRLHGPGPDDGIVAAWRQLWDWAQTGTHRWLRGGQELEKALNPDAPEEELVLELYLPLKS